MSSLETTELKLKTTPTGGLEAHTSPYYRRLVSAGYKGFLQGTIGGASLYGTLGAVVGGLVAVPLALFAPVTVGLAAFTLIPAGAALGIAKGASTFGQIGSVAAINAESADLSEQRRYLLDMYYDLPDTPDGNARAAAIKQELAARSRDAQKPEHMFHWKTVAVCALIGAAIAGAAVWMIAPGLLAAGATGESIAVAIGSTLGTHVSAGFGEALLVLKLPGMLAIGSAIGAAAGATVGLDRYYIRKWFDKTQDIVHSSAHDYGLMERHQEVQRLKDAAQEDAKTKQQHSEAQASAEPAVKESEPKGSVIKPVANLDAPANRITSAKREGLTAEELKHAFEVPAV